MTQPLYVPVPPLVVDTTTLPDAGGYGFLLRNAEGNRLTTSSVTIIDDGTGTAPGSTKGIGKVRIVASATLPAGASLEYAYSATQGAIVGRSAAWGNIHDSDNTPSRFVHDVTLWNWCLTFQKDL